MNTERVMTMRGRGQYKKANALIEYGVILMIVAGAIFGLYYELKRAIQARVKRESDSHIGHAIGLEWPEQTQTLSWARSQYTRQEVAGSANPNVDAQTNIRSDSSGGSITYSFPVPEKLMKHKKASRDVQDAVGQPPKPQYPDLDYEKWQDKGWPKPD